MSEAPAILPASRIAQALDGLRAEIASVAGADWTGRITLVAASKTVGAETVRAAHALGISDFGENRAQDLAAKATALADLPIRWHFIGHLQTNKARLVAQRAFMVHSVDSLHLAEALDRECRKLGRRLPVLLQVNVSGEASKGGFEPGEVAGALETMARWDGRALDVEGLMTMAPLTDDAGLVRETFRGLARLRERLARELAAAASSSPPALRHLSMGMTGDFRIALEEGATMLRIGSRIFAS